MDIYHYFGNDLVVSVHGDLATVDVPVYTQQRILRRLLTAPGSYVFHPTYGAGLPQYIGVALSQTVYQQIQSTIQSQMYLEPTVSQFPAPVITLSQIPNGLYCNITYTDSVSNTVQVLSFTASL